MKKFIITDITLSEGILYLTARPKKLSSAFRFKPGQYAAIGFRGENGRKSPVRCFSITSVATDTRSVQFAIRILGDFSRALAHQKKGAVLYLQGPYGDFCIDPRNDHNIVMLAGGIGITPFMSMIRSASAQGTQLPLTLYYSSRTGHNIPFYDELCALEKNNKYFRVAFFITDKQTIPPESRLMLSGRITEEHINHIVQKSYAGSTYFICGPKGFMDHTETLLTDKGVSENQIITESFTQASKLSFASGLNVRTATYAFSAGLLLLTLLGIAFLDLSHYLPESTASALPVTPSSSTSNTSSDTESSTTDNTTSSQSTGSSTTSSPSNNQSTYQSPVSSVS